MPGPAPKWKYPTQTRTYHAWCAMRQRCRPGNSGAKNHGDRGIRVCEAWEQSFDQFVDDMGLTPEGLTLERNDNDGDYTPDNCRWATDAEQRLNKRNNRRLTFNGETKTVTEWATELGVPVNRLWNRVQKGEPLERILTQGLLKVAVLTHGTLNGYNYHKCRCTECRSANNEYQKARKRCLT